MKRNNVAKALVLLSLASAFALGCELIVDFDRTRIPPEDAGAALPDATLPDTGTPEASTPTTDAGDGGAADADAGGDIVDAGDDAADADAGQ